MSLRTLPASENAIGVRAMAERLGVSESTVYIKAKSGEIPGFKVGKVWRFYPSAVDAHLQREHDPWEMPAASARARRAS